MPPETETLAQDDLVKQVLALPAEQRHTLLVNAIMRGGRGFEVLVSQIRLITALASFFRVEVRFRVAEILRDSADQVERLPIRHESNASKS